MAVLERTTSPTQSGDLHAESGEHEGRMQTMRARQLGVIRGPFDKPTLKPYWGKPAVRNFRGDDGNVGIIRSPIRAIALPDLCAVRWYLRYSLSLRDVEELLEERGLNLDHTTVWRWVQYYGPELEQRLRQHLKPTNKSWRVDETYVRVKGRWCYLYRAIDSKGATIDFLLSALRDADAAKRLFRKALSDRSHPQPRVINTDLAPIYSSAIPDFIRAHMDVLVGTDFFTVEVLTLKGLVTYYV